MMKKTTLAGYGYLLNALYQRLSKLSEVKSSSYTHNNYGTVLSIFLIFPVKF
jgi:hypothetical protein